MPPQGVAEFIEFSLARQTGIIHLDKLPRQRPAVRSMMKIEVVVVNGGQPNGNDWRLVLASKALNPPGFPIPYFNGFS